MRIAASVVFNCSPFFIFDLTIVDVDVVLQEWRGQYRELQNHHSLQIKSSQNCLMLSARPLFLEYKQSNCLCVARLQAPSYEIIA